MAAIIKNTRKAYVASGQRVDSALKVEPKREEKWKGIFHFSKPKKVALS